MTTQNLELDASNRTRALALNSFIVEAPAGAGKTELLTQRYLRLLQTVNAPEEIIAITFTNKAAAEMRLRILDSLINAANGVTPDKAHKQITYDLSQQALQHAQAKQWQLIENPSRLRIFTIDSLCAHLARQMPLMSRFGAQPSIADDAGILYAEAAEQTLALLEDAEHGTTVKTALRYVENNADQLKNLLMLMLEKRDQWLHHAQQSVDIPAMQQALRHLIQQTLQAALDALPLALQHVLMPTARFAASHLPCEHCVALLADWETPLQAKPEAIALWRAVTDLMLTDKGEPRKEGGLNIKFGFPPTDEGKAHKRTLVDTIAAVNDLAALHRVRQLPDLTHDTEQWHMIAALSQLLKLAVGQLWLTFQAAGQVDFTEIASRATQALSNDTDEPTDLALRLDYQIQHLLVDEFQDTSPSQIELLKRLTAGWQAGDGRTLFAVGDPMQSIYRFRKANVGLFIDAAQHGIGDIQLEKLQLYRNNRSCPPVIDWINDSFAQIFPAFDNMDKGAVRYRPFIATKENGGASGVETHPIISTPDETQETANQREAATVIEIIQREHEQDANKTIAVLVRSKKHLANLVTQLRRNHPEIAFQAVEIEALQGRQVVQDLLSLTHALHHRADRVHWLAVLRAPWCGLTLHDLHVLAGDNHTGTIWSLMQNEAIVSRLSEDGQRRLTHLRDIFSEAFATQGRINTSRWVRGIWLMLNGATCLWEQADVVDVQAFFACMDSLDRSNQFTPERMETEITKLFATPDAEGGHLQMMTIHKSKGLEFDTVILPGLGAKSGGNNSNQPLVLWEEVIIQDEAQLIAAPFIPKGLRAQDSVSAYDYLATLEKERDAHEDARILYVAATRAERKLHLVGIANQNTKGELKPLANTYLDMLWQTVASDFEAVAVDTQPRALTPDTANTLADFTPHLVRLKHVQLPEVLQTGKSLASPQPFVTAKKSISNAIEADIGTLAHKYLEIIANQGVNHWNTERVAKQHATMQHWLKQQGHTPDACVNAAKTVIVLLNTTLNSTDGLWVLQHRESAQNEFAITTTYDGEIRNYVIDRTFIENSVRWIIDYKSIALDTQTNEAMLKAIAEQFRPQLENYETLFSTENLPIQKAILFLSVGKIVLI